LDGWHGTGTFDRRGAETFIVPISSGVIAAEGLMAIGMALYRAF
jgi:hypothetical protein